MVVDKRWWKQCGNRGWGYNVPGQIVVIDGSEVNEVMGAVFIVLENPV